jgi:hypothetical protein
MKDAPPFVLFWRRFNGSWPPSKHLCVCVDICLSGLTHRHSIFVSLVFFYFLLIYFFRSFSLYYLLSLSVSDLFISSFFLFLFSFHLAPSYLFYLDFLLYYSICTLFLLFLFFSASLLCFLDFYFTFISCSPLSLSTYLLFLSFSSVSYSTFLSLFFLYSFLSPYFSFCLLFLFLVFILLSFFLFFTIRSVLRILFLFRLFFSPSLSHVIFPLLPFNSFSPYSLSGPFSQSYFRFYSFFVSYRLLSTLSNAL